MLDETAGARLGPCAVAVNLRDCDLADQVDNQSPDLVSVHIGTVPIWTREKPTQGHNIA
jgi:hypothetical protein